MNPRRALRALRHVDRAPEVWRCIRQSGDWPALVGGYLGLGGPRYPREFRTPWGDAMELREYHDLVTAWIIFYRREYRVDPAAATIVDAGANIGAFSLYAARVAPGSRVVALEPFPATRERLEGHVARNGLGDRVAVRPWALAGSEGRRSMSVDVPSQSRGLTDPDTAGGPTVEAITLATLWAREGLERVDLLKMDIEGAEHEAVAAASPEDLRRAAAIALEYHPNAPRGPLFGRLRDAGFDLVEDEPVGPDSGTAHFLRRP